MKKSTKSVAIASVLAAALTLPIAVKLVTAQNTAGVVEVSEYA